MKLPGFITSFWRWFRKPSRLAIGTILIVGFGAGIIFWGGFNTGMEMTNREEFCIGCHEMRENVYEEYVGTITTPTAVVCGQPVRTVMCQKSGCRR